MSNTYATAAFAKGRPNHTKEELNDVASAAKAGDPKAAQTLGQMVQPYVIAYLRRIKGDYTPEQRNEMTQAAWVGVYEALDRWDPDAGVKFNTFAYYFYHGEVQLWLAANSGVIPLPRTAWADAHRIEKVVLERTNGERMPYELSDDELAAIEVITDSKTKRFKSAGDAFRARQASYSVETPEDAQRASQSAEEAFFEGREVDLDREVLAAIDFIRESDDDDMRWTIALDLEELLDEHGFDVPAHHILDVAEGPA